MDDEVDLADALASFDEAFQSRIVGEHNGNRLQVAKTRGEFVWHSHPEADDLAGTPNTGDSTEREAAAELRFP